MSLCLHNLSSIITLTLTICLPFIAANPWAKGATIDASSISIDTTLRASASSGPDRSWFVGDHGAILATENGGRTWSAQQSGTSLSLYGVGFESERIGWAVGGEVLPYSHRSRGIVLRTEDGGLRWQATESKDLPRLKGIQTIGQGQLIAWGDWSPAYQSGLLESHDGGRTWNPKSIPTTHIQCAAWLNTHCGIVVDRLSRVYRFDGEAKSELIDIAGDPSRPILAAAVNEHGWWLVGAQGQVYWSENGKRWVQRHLPGLPLDQQLITLQTIALNGNDVWIGGLPGNVVWNSRDLGATWEVVPLPNQLPVLSLQVPTPDSVCFGSLAGLIMGTRNRGHGWWTLHGTAARVAMLNIASTVESMAWDTMAYMANETRHHVASVVVHSQRPHEQTDVFVDLPTRAAQAAVLTSLADMTIEPGFPIGDLVHGRRPSDSWGYSKASSDIPSTITNRMVVWLRAYRPDILVVESDTAQDSLLRATCQATQQARRLASQAEFRCFSPISQIPETAWSIQRVICRQDYNRSLVTKNYHKGELNYNSGTTLKSSGLLLTDLISPIAKLIDRPWDYSENRRETDDFYGNYTIVYGGRNAIGKDTLLADLTTDKETRRSSNVSTKRNLQALMASIQTDQLMQRLLDMPGADNAHDSRWKAALQTWTRSMSPSRRPDMLWELAQGYRHRGCWNRWKASLEELIGESPSSGAAELAAIQLLLLHASHEIETVRKASHEQNVAIEVRSDQSNQVAISPFQLGVMPVSHVAKKTSAPPRFADQVPQLVDHLQLNFPQLHYDPRWLAAKASVERRSDGVRSSPSHSLSMVKMATIHGSAAWEQIVAQEIDPHANAIAVPKAAERPRLDGRIEESIWNRALPIRLSSSWNDENLAYSEVRVMCDEEFIFFGATLPNIVSQFQTEPAEDELLTIRIDTDRDYLTWFEIGFDRKGNVKERCCDLNSWHPEWFFKTINSETGWSIEAAFPRKIFQSDSNTDAIWGMAFHREISGVSSQSSRPMFNDRLLPASTMLLRFER
jgi:photosystem II stability/assembly factor-like uncharacterized protein